MVGDFENGNLYILDLDAFDDAGRKRKWLRSFALQPTGQITLRNNRVNRLQLYCEVGVGASNVDEVRALNVTDFVRSLNDKNKVRVLSGPPPFNEEDTIDPQVMLRWSDTGGMSFGNEHWRPLGKIGELQHRVIWRRLGSSRDRVFEFSGTSRCKIALVGCFADIDPGVS